MYRFAPSQNFAAPNFAVANILSKYYANGAIFPLLASQDKTLAKQVIRFMEPFFDEDELASFKSSRSNDEGQTKRAAALACKTACRFLRYTATTNMQVTPPAKRFLADVVKINKPLTPSQVANWVFRDTMDWASNVGLVLKCTKDLHPDFNRTVQEWVAADLRRRDAA